jgi:hypothetical protein
LSKTGRKRFLVIFCVILAGLLGLGLVGVIVSATDTAPPCPKDEQCGNPPKPPDGAPALVSGTIWKSDIGAQMEYYPNLWKVVSQDGRDLKLDLSIPGRDDLNLFLWVKVAKTSESKREDLANDQIDSLKKDILALKQDDGAGSQILDPALGYVDGIGSPYEGAVDTPQGPGNPVHVLLMAATEGDVTATVAASSTTDNRAIFGLADTLLNTFRFHTAAAP